MKFRFVLAVVLGLSPFAAHPLEAAPRDPAAPLDLLQAAANGDMRLLRSALRRGAPLEIRDSQYFFTPLGWAAWRGQSKAVSALIAADANPNARSVGGAQMPVTLKMPMMGDMAVPEPSDQTPLILAILGNTPRATSIARDLLQHGANPNTRNNAGNTPLLYASIMSQPALVSALLAKGANPNARSEKDILSPLIGVVMRLEGEDPALVKTMLAAGANPNDYFLQRPLAFMARFAKRNRSAALLETAQKQKLQNQIREAAKPPIIYPESNSIPTFLE